MRQGLRSNVCTAAKFVSLQVAHRFRLLRTDVKWSGQRKLLSKMSMNRGCRDQIR